MFKLLEFLVLHQCHIDSVRRAHESSSVDLGALGWVGPSTVLASIGGVLLTRFVAMALLKPGPPFGPLNLMLTVVDTAAFVSLGVWTFKRVASLALDPIGTYRIIAFKALLLSFLPDIALGMSHFPAATWPNVFALMAEHVAAWAVCVSMLTQLARTSGATLADREAPRA